jgi:hypothetical protein
MCSRERESRSRSARAIRRVALFYKDSGDSGAKAGLP